MVKSGLLYSFGVGFWGPNGHDGVWHIALANSLAKGNNEMPIFANSILKNYHIGYDLMLAIVHKITAIPISILYFQVFPVLISVSVGILVYKLVYTWKSSKVMAFWSTFFVYFGGNFGWVITYVRSREISGESMFWSQQAISTLINPPFALSLIFILIGFLLLQKFNTKPLGRYILFAILAFGLLIQVKAYAGVIVLISLFITGVYEFWQKKSLEYLKLWLFSTLISLAVFLPFAGFRFNSTI